MTVAGTFRPGTNVTYTVVLQNGGAQAQLDNPGDEFTDVLPAELALVSSSASSGTTSLVVERNEHGFATNIMAMPTVHWNGSIPAGGSVTITIVAQVVNGTPAGTSVSSQGTAFYDADGNGTNESSRLTNDPSTAAADDPTTFSVVSPATITSPSKAENRLTATAGDSIVYTITIPNSGPSAQSDNPGNEFVDVLPSQLDLVSATASSGTAVATIGTRTVTWNGTIPASGSVTITINATVNATASSAVTVSNQGTVNFDADGNGTNESSVVTDDPATPAVSDPTIFAVTGSAIPTLSPLALLLLSAVIAAVALLALRRMS
jgi:uncharacterized repeat protein (TIGR01451 family)